MKLLQEFILLESDAEPETLVLNFGLGAILCLIFNSRINKEWSAFFFLSPFMRACGGVKVNLLDIDVNWTLNKQFGPVSISFSLMILIFFFKDLILFINFLIIYNSDVLNVHYI